MSNRAARSLAWVTVGLAFWAPFFAGSEQVVAAQPSLAASSSAVTSTAPAQGETKASAPATPASSALPTSRQSVAATASSSTSQATKPAAAAAKPTTSKPSQVISKPSQVTSTPPRPRPAQTAATASPTTAASGIKGRHQVVETTPFQAAGATRRGGPVTAAPTQSTFVGPALPPPVVQDAPGVVTARTDLAGSVLALTNQQRARAGLPALAFNGCTGSRVAQPWATHMATVQRSYHSNVRQVLSSCGGVTAGENISSGWTSPEAAVAAWMGSPTHRANILNRRFTTIGIGIAQAPDGTFYWVQSFNG